jgi:hypothetical protein
VRASSHTLSNSEKVKVYTTATQKAMKCPWTCGVSKMGRSEKREEGGKNLGPGLTGEGHIPGGKQRPVNPTIVSNGFLKILLPLFICNLDAKKHSGGYKKRGINN